MRGFARSFGVLGAAAMTAIASAQSAQIVVSHDDPDGIVNPGQMVRITYHLGWGQFFALASMKGDAIVTPNEGGAFNPVNGLNGGLPAPGIGPGVPEGGSIRGFSAQIPPPFFLGFSPLGFGLAAGGAMR